FYNTNVLNRYQTDEARKQESADFEKAYRQYKGLPQPRITAFKADVDIYPESLRAVVRGHYRIENKHDVPLDEFHVTLDSRITVKKLEFAAHSVVKAHKDNGYTIYKLEQPMQPGAAMDFDFELEYAQRGFGINGGQTQIVENGTFFNNFSMPH